MPTLQELLGLSDPYQYQPPPPIPGMSPPPMPTPTPTMMPQPMGLPPPGVPQSPGLLSGLPAEMPPMSYGVDSSGMPPPPLEGLGGMVRGASVPGMPPIPPSMPPPPQPARGTVSGQGQPATARSVLTGFANAPNINDPRHPAWPIGQAGEIASTLPSMATDAFSAAGSAASAIPGMMPNLMPGIGGGPVRDQPFSAPPPGAPNFGNVQSGGSTAALIQQAQQTPGSFVAPAAAAGADGGAKDAVLAMAGDQATRQRLGMRRPDSGRKMPDMISPAGEATDDASPGRGTQPTGAMMLPGNTSRARELVRRMNAGQPPLGKATAPGTLFAESPAGAPYGGDDELAQSVAPRQAGQKGLAPGVLLGESAAGQDSSFNQTDMGWGEKAQKGFNLLQGIIKTPINLLNKLVIHPLQEITGAPAAQQRAIIDEAAQGMDERLRTMVAQGVLDEEDYYRIMGHSKPQLQKLRKRQQSGLNSESAAGVESDPTRVGGVMGGFAEFLFTGADEETRKNYGQLLRYRQVMAQNELELKQKAAKLKTRKDELAVNKGELEAEYLPQIVQAEAANSLLKPEATQARIDASRASLLRSQSGLGSDADAAADRAEKRAERETKKSAAAAALADLEKTDPAKAARVRQIMALNGGKLPASVWTDDSDPTANLDTAQRLLNKDIDDILNDPDLSDAEKKKRVEMRGGSTEGGDLSYWPGESAIGVKQYPQAKGPTGGKGPGLLGGGGDGGLAPDGSASTTQGAQGQASTAAGTSTSPTSKSAASYADLPALQAAAKAGTVSPAEAKQIARDRGWAK